MVEPASRAAVQRAAGCCLARLVVWCPTALTEPSHDMNIAAKAALKKRTSLTAADNDLSSTVTARQAHAASTTLRAEPGAAAAGGASGGGGSEASLCLMGQASSLLRVAPIFSVAAGPSLDRWQTDETRDQTALVR